jgi:prolipoprotein diacylglyceryltransferase
MWAGRRFAAWLRDGDTFGLYVIWYGLGRSWVELFFRPDAWTIGALPTAVWISLGLTALGVLVLLVNHLLLPRFRPAAA